MDRYLSLRNSASADAAKQEIVRLEKAIGGNEQAINAMHDQIATLADDLDTNDLAFL